MTVPDAVSCAVSMVGPSTGPPVVSMYQYIDTISRSLLEVNAHPSAHELPTSAQSRQTFD